MYHNSFQQKSTLYMYTVREYHQWPINLFFYLLNEINLFAKYINNRKNEMSFHRKYMVTIQNHTFSTINGIHIIKINIQFFRSFQYFMDYSIMHFIVHILIHTCTAIINPFNYNVNKFLCQILGYNCYINYFRYILQIQIFFLKLIKRKRWIKNNV